MNYLLHILIGVNTTISFLTYLRLLELDNKVRSRFINNRILYASK